MLNIEHMVVIYLGLCYLGSIGIAFGMTFAHFQKEFKVLEKDYFWSNLIYSAVFSLTGIVMITTILYIQRTNTAKIHHGLLYPSFDYYKQLMKK
jgi:hypothetical protein